MGAPLNIAQAADLVDLSIQKIFLKTSEAEAQYKKYFNYRTTEDYYEKDSGLSGLGEATFLDENAAMIADVPVQTYDKTYTQEVVSSLVTFTMKMLISSISWMATSLYKFRKLQGTLYETICSQTQKWGGSTTIIGGTHVVHGIV